MNFIGLTKEAEDYLHASGQVMSYMYAVELPDGQVAHLRAYIDHEHRTPVTCSSGGGLVEVPQEYVGGSLFTCLVSDPGWSYWSDILLPGKYTRVRMVYDEALKCYKLAEEVALDNAMYKWKREPRGEVHPMWGINSTTGTIPNAWFPPDTKPEE